MELYVFDLNLNHLGLIDNYIELKVENHYTKMGQLSLRTDASKNNIELLQKNRILVKKNDLTRGYLINTREYEDENSAVLQVIAPSLNSLLNRRIVKGQQVYTDNLERSIKKFVYYNAISTTANRIIPNLDVDYDYKCDLGNGTETAASGVHLDDLSYELCNKYDCSWDLVIDLTNKKYIYTTWKGTDRSAEQTINPHVIFSKSFDNVIRQHYVESDSNFKTTAIVAGEGEGVARKYVDVNDNLSGFDRFETFVDARDLQSTYTDENDTEVTLTTQQYEDLLVERGKQKLAEFQKITTFESEVDLFSNHVYGTDYFLGDKVSIRNDDLNIIMHTRIISATETYNRSGTTLEINFGTNIPTFLDKVKRAVK